MAPKKIDPKKVVSGIFSGSQSEKSSVDEERVSSLMGDRDKRSKRAKQAGEQRGTKRGGFPTLLEGVWRNEFGAIDLGNDSIKFLLLNYDGRKICIKDIQVEKVVPATSQDDVPAEREKELMNGLIRISTRVKSKLRVAISLNDPSLFVDLLKVPMVPDSECRELVGKSLSEKRLIDIESSFFDYTEAEEVGWSDARELLVIAAPKDLVYREFEIVQSAGFKVLGVETNALATLHALKQAAKWGDHEQILVLDVGHRYTDLSIIIGNRITFSRTIPIAGERFTRAIQEAMECGFDDAELLKVKYGLSTLKKGREQTPQTPPLKQDGGSQPFRDVSAEKITPPEEAAQVPSQQDIPEAERVSLAVMSEVEKLFVEIERSFQFAVAKDVNAEGIQIDNIFLFGGGSRLLRLREFMREKWGVPIRDVNLWEGLNIDDRHIDREFLSEANDIAAVSLGLALRIRDWKVLPFGWGMPA
jgi:type IV pilus assembly protein PilM